MSKKFLVWFEEVGKDDVGLVGGKGANLGEMLNSKFPVPYGFIVTSHAYFYFIEKNNLRQKIKDLLSIVNYENPKELTDISKAIKNLFFEAKIPSDLINKIIEYYSNLTTREVKILRKGDQALSRIKSLFNPPLVAVRSSATAEDLPTASFAGQQETFLNVKGENHLIEKIRQCWASLFTERAIYYRHQQNFDHLQVGLASVVQRMIQSEKSGIAFSIDPVTNNKSVITIEAVFGLGEYIVQGKVTPDHYEVDKKSLKINKKEIKRQTLKFIKKERENVEIKLTLAEGTKAKLNDQEILKIALLTKNIEKHYFFPQDIEWAIENGQVYIVQSRPITTIKSQISNNQFPISPTFQSESDQKHRTNQISNLKFQISNFLLLKGDPASPGIRYGPPVVIYSPKEIDRIKKGDVLVAPQTNPDYVPAMRKASAIITEKGGRTSHAAIVSRELGIPAVVGAEKATKILKHEKIISVNGSTGEIFRGNVLSTVKKTSEVLGISPKTSEVKTIKTKTKIYVNLAEPEQAEKIAKMDVDGVGLLRAEFMIADFGIHPRQIIKEKKEKLFIRHLARNLLIFAKAFSPRPVVYRATDFKTNEYRHLLGGSTFEPKEENPMLGFRGASRYIVDKEVFVMELEAIKRVRKEGYKNINLMIPFIRSPIELLQIRQILADCQLLNLPSFKLWIMVEVPSTAILLQDFIKIGIDGVSIGTNDLTMLIMGVDRDNQEIAHLYNETNPAVLWILEKIVKICKKSEISCSVCGQAASDYPELAEKLVAWGITSLSLNPDAVERTKLQVFEAEKKLWQKLKK
jgi:pyruvate,water dikinase